ncbi:MAG: NAD(P)/FAD-dependent oxidoreductase, partial [Proteobacteria bacterium]|nr:NAD(P)/FAD-dependent oxidoreductase [Pseudomonadota bacterium]
GADVVVLDEQAEPGGQIYRAIESVERDRPADLSFLGDAYAHGSTVAGAFRAVRTDYRPGSTVWQVGDLGKGKRRDVVYSRNGVAETLSVKHLVIATGALERPVPILGWTLPGVMTVGAVQSALKTSGIYPAGNLVLAGSGPLMLQLAAQLIDAHVPIAGIVDTTPPGGLSRAFFHLPRALAAGETLLKGWRMVRTVNRSGVPIYRGATHLQAHGPAQGGGEQGGGEQGGGEKVTSLSFRSQGADYTIDADVVALHEGVIPNTQLSRLLQAEHRWDDRQRCFHPLTNQWGETSEPGVYVAGDGGGIAGGLAAARSGMITGLAVAQSLGLMAEAARDFTSEEQRLRRFIDLSIRPFLDSYYPAPDWIGAVGDDVILCRCEEVTAGQLRAAMAHGCSGPNQAKSFLRCGMGACQGRMCAASVTEVMAATGGATPDAVGSFRIRPPIKPVTLAEVATLDAG